MKVIFLTLKILLFSLLVIGIVSCSSESSNQDEQQGSSFDKQAEKTAGKIISQLTTPIEKAREAARVTTQDNNRTKQQIESPEKQ